MSSFNISNDDAIDEDSGFSKPHVPKVGGGNKRLFKEAEKEHIKTVISRRF